MIMNASEKHYAYLDPHLPKIFKNYLKSIFIYKILNNHTAPSLKASFRLNNEHNNTYDRRNRETDLSLPKPNTDSGKRCFKYNGAVAWNNFSCHMRQK